MVRQAKDAGESTRWRGERRRLLSALAALAAGAAPAGAAAAATAQGAEHRRHMDAAFAERERALAAGDQPFGAVVVRDGRVVGRGPSRVVSARDPTAHAEMEAIREACRTLGSADLSGCRLYASFKPCPMCETAAYWARIERFYFGDALSDGGRPGYCG